jgi:Nickel responsive protein SCO4226-like
MLYAAKCYWPGVDERELSRVTARARHAGSSSARDEGVAYVGSLLFAEDDLVLCLFEAPSRAAVKRASDRAGIPCERVMDSAWLGAGRGDLKGAMR